jgi:hypothetical protein
MIIGSARAAVEMEKTDLMAKNRPAKEKEG